MITIQDTLLNPVSQPLDFATIYFVSVDSTGIPLKQAQASVMTDGEGAFTCTLAEGTYRVYLEQAEFMVKYPVGYILGTSFGSITESTLTALIVGELPDDE